MCSLVPFLPSWWLRAATVRSQPGRASRPRTAGRREGQRGWRQVHWGALHAERLQR